MKQVIRKKIIEKHDIDISQPIMTLIVDGNSLLKTSLVANKLNEDGKDYAAIITFFNTLKKILEWRNWQFCYCFWDGDGSGVLRYDYLKTYKQNRDKHYEFFDTSTEYDKKIAEYCKKVLAYKKGKQVEIKRGETDDERFQREREIIMQINEELCIRQLIEDCCEGDDLIAYYIKNKKPNEKICIISGDRDLTQLINDDVCVYAIQLKKTITPENHIKEIGYCHENVLLKKIFLGDVSDNIKGIKGLGEKTFFDLFPDVLTHRVSVDDIINQAKIINEQRAKEKKKPLRVCENIINAVCDGEQGDKIYEINKKIIDLSEPLLTENAKEDLDNLSYAPLDMEGRDFNNVYQIILSNKINDLLDSEKFGNFFAPFNLLIHNEKHFKGL